MPLELVTGPANAEKAGLVLGAVRREAQAGAEPLLVVPTGRDVEVYRRELAGDGAALGTQVLHFGGLMREMARRAQVAGGPLGAIGCERVAASVADALSGAGRLRAMQDAAQTGGFPSALARFCGELAEARCDPRRFARAMAIWGRAEEREAFASDLASLYGGYAARLERLGRTDAAGHAWLVLDALRLRPAAWGGTPVAMYGFDDLTAVELDAVTTLSEHVGAAVTLSLPFEVRGAFAGRQRTWFALSQLAGARVVALEASDQHYEPASAAALHGLERALFERAGTVEPGQAIELLEGGDPRAELELIAERVGTLLDEGTAPGEIAVALRDSSAAASLVDAVFSEAGIEVSHEHRIAVRRTGLGRGLLALLRCALLDGGARDLLLWLRAPGAPGGSGRRVDSLEATIRELGLRDAESALAEWSRLGGHELAAIARLREASARGRGELYDALLREATRMLAAPHRAGDAGSAPLLGAGQRADAAVVTGVARALEELRELGRADDRLAPGDRALHDLLADVEVQAGDASRPGAVLVADPLALRARRVDVLVLGRLQEGVFPRPGRAEPFLSDEARRSIDRALADTGEPPLLLREHEDPLDAERYQLYAAVSRPRARLILSWHRADEDGEPVVCSPFVDDVLDALSGPPGRRDRRMGSVAWPGDARLGPHQRALSEALASGEERLREAGDEHRRAGRLTHPAILAELAAREAWSATELEVYARCPVRWFVERLLRPGTIEPDGEPLSRGRVGHGALERTLRELAGNGERLEQRTLERSIERLRHHLREEEAANPISSDPHRRLAELGRLEADLVRYLEHQVEVGSSFTPSGFELEFGVAGADLPPVDLGELTVRGRIDRVDRSPDGSEVIIVDYKGRTAQTPGDKWLEEGLLQAGLYARAIECLEQDSGTRVVGALYQPIGAEREAMRARGFVEQGADPGARHADRITAEERDALLDAILVEAGRLTRQISSGRLTARPDRCSWNDKGCAYPSICRCEA